MTRPTIRLIPLAAMVLAFAATTACSPIGMAVGAGATAATAAFQERPVGQALNDTEIKLGLNDRLLKSDSGLFSRVSTTVIEGRVMLTGLVEKDADRAEAGRLAWTVPDVREVINEIEVADKSTLETLPADEWIATKLKARLLTDFDVSDINYSTDVVNGSVYILGIGRDPAEIDRVANHARDINGVRRVVMHAITKDDPVRMAARPASAPEPIPFERQPSGPRQGYALAESNQTTDVLTGQTAPRVDMSQYDERPAIEPATTASIDPAYTSPQYGQQDYGNGSYAGSPRSITPRATTDVESRPLPDVR